MTVRTFIIGSVIGAIIGCGMWLLVVTQLKPDQASWLGFTLFFLSLFLALASISGLLGYLVRRLVTAREFGPYTVRTSLRQGIMLGIFFVTLLLLQLMRIYQWWIAIILIVLCASFELVFLSYDKAHARRAQKTAE
jgi:Ca2+/Na+ antiporter